MKEYEIRPEALLNRYLELCAHDAEKYFYNKPRLTVACVACGESNDIHQFDKNGFAYTKCDDCATLFQSPRPNIEDFESFYRESESSRYWAEVFFPAVAETRREKIFRPRVKRLGEICEKKNIHVENLIDVGAGYGIFLDEWVQHFPHTHALAIEPSKSLAKECKDKGISVVNEIVENVKGHENSADLVVCFEVLEHVYDPLFFIQVLKELARPGGYVFISTLCINGFDLQVLWDKSSQISPPHHINFLSQQGFKKLFDRAGLHDLTITTPGQLDVDIVRNFVKQNPEILDKQRFLRNLLADNEHAAAFQAFLQEQHLSSHSWIIGRKPYES